MAFQKRLNSKSACPGLDSREIGRIVFDKVEEAWQFKLDGT